MGQKDLTQTFLDPRMIGSSKNMSCEIEAVLVPFVQNAGQATSKWSITVMKRNGKKDNYSIYILYIRVYVHVYYIFVYIYVCINKYMYFSLADLFTAYKNEDWKRHEPSDSLF